MTTLRDWKYCPKKEPAFSSYSHRKTATYIRGTVMYVKNAYIHSMQKYWVYMLRCCDDSYYIGVTNDLNMRLEEHVTGFKEGSYTHKRLPVELVYQESFQYIVNAIAWEKRIKRWSRKKKIALIANDTNELRKLSHAPSQPELQRWQYVEHGDIRRCHPEPDEG